MPKEFPIGLPLHQIPKAKEYRRLIVPPEGRYFIVADVDSQETHLMAELSEDPALLDVYYNGLDPHSLTASRIANCAYKEVIEGKEAEDPYYLRMRKAGKVVNLARNYRCGIRTTYNQAHVQWGMDDVIESEVRNWHRAWNGLYQAVPQYWDKAIARARHYGYAETLAGRRFGIHKWGGSTGWKSESSAIIVPIQGSGADMKYLAIAIMRRRFPELTYWGEIHDEIIYTFDSNNILRLTKEIKAGMKKGSEYVSEDVVLLAEVEAKCCQIKEALDNLPFEKAWGWRPKIPFTWSVGYGRSWGDIVEVK